jgi:hypothetical protein
MIRFAMARGATVQFCPDPASGVWYFSSWGPHKPEKADRWRVAPQDEHLSYGVIATQFRKGALRKVPYLDVYDLSDILVPLFPLIELNYIEMLDYVDIRNRIQNGTWLLFAAEILADEGL